MLKASFKMPVPCPENEKPLRDEFAMEAMKEFITSFNIFNAKPLHIENVGKISYAIADSMMLARKNIWSNPDKVEVTNAK